MTARLSHHPCPHISVRAVTLASPSESSCSVPPRPSRRAAELSARPPARLAALRPPQTPPWRTPGGFVHPSLRTRARKRSQGRARCGREPRARRSPAGIEGPHNTPEAHASSPGARRTRGAPEPPILCPPALPFPQDRCSSGGLRWINPFRADSPPTFPQLSGPGLPAIT